MPTKRCFAWLAELAGHGHGEVSDQLRIGIPRSADLTPEHHELLGAAVHFRVRGSLSALGHPQAGSMCSAASVASQHMQGPTQTRRSVNNEVQAAPVVGAR